MQSSFIERLRQVVEQVGGQKELERLSGVDQTTISAWLKRLKNPKFQTVKKIADATGFGAEWLYLGQGPRRSRDELPTSQPTIDIDLLADIIEHVEDALTMRGTEYRMKPADKAQVIALAYDFYQRSGSAGVKRARILDFMRRRAAP